MATGKNWRGRHSGKAAAEQGALGPLFLANRTE